MQQVQTTIHFATDYHRHDHGTDKLVHMTPGKRQQFLLACMERLHGGRIADFKATCQSPEFRPILTVEKGTQHPSIRSIHDAIQYAIKKYNAGDFPIQFSTTLGAVEHKHAAPESRQLAAAGHQQHTAAEPRQLATAEPRQLATAEHTTPPDCIQWYWVGDEKVYKYNWNGRILNEAAPKEGDLAGSYRLALTYSELPEGGSPA